MGVLRAKGTGWAKGPGTGEMVKLRAQGEWWAQGAGDMGVLRTQRQGVPDPGDIGVLRA